MLKMEMMGLGLVPWWCDWAGGGFIHTFLPEIFRFFSRVCVKHILGNLSGVSVCISLLYFLDVI